MSFTCFQSRKIFWVIVSVLFATLAFTVYRHLPVLGVRASSATYTVVRTETGYDKAGVSHYTNLYTEAQRADGSRVLETQTAVERRRTLFFPNGDMILTNEHSGKKSTYPRRYSGVPNQKAPGSSCQSVEDARAGFVTEGYDLINGFQAVRRSRPSSDRKWIVWHAPDAGCALVQLRFEHEDGVTVQSLTSLSTSEPRADMFTVPDTFQEVAPSELYPTLGSSQKRRLDDNYIALRTKVAQ